MLFHLSHPLSLDFSIIIFFILSITLLKILINKILIIFLLMIYVLHHIISIHKKTPEPASSGSAAPIHSIQFFVFSASGIVIHLKYIKTHQFIMVRF